MKKLSLMTAIVLCAGCATHSDNAQLKKFIARHVAKVEPLSIQYNLAYWDSHTTGKSEDYDRLRQFDLRIKQVYSDSEDFRLVKQFRETARITDLRLARQVDKLYYAYLPNQVDPKLLAKIAALDAAVQEKYSSFRGTIEGKKVTMSDIYTIVTTEKDCRKRELAWRASKQVGNAIVDDLIRLVKLRNQAARELGFDNYHTLSVVAGEQDPRQIAAMFDELDDLTRGPFAKMKAELDAVLAKGYGIKPAELMPWHYHDPFFQRSPLVYELDLDAYYKGRDVRQLALDCYGGVGLPVDDILARSDLYDREGKYPHAFSHDVDRSGDVRILCNLQDTERWMETILHELGHAVYSKHHDRGEPWLLREPAHSFTTEAVAMFFGRLSRNAAWMQEMLDLTNEQRRQIEQVSDRYMRFQQVLMARWVMVMFNFERQLYADPDQELNTLWWDLVEKYQFMKRPPGKPDAGWASKLHFVSAPCYYHNYLLGELLASQFHHHLVKDVLRAESDTDVSYVGDKRIGDFFKKDVFGPGARYRWNETIERATGEPLSPRHFVEQFVE